MAPVSTNGAVLERLDALHHGIEELSQQLAALMAAASTPKTAAVKVVSSMSKPTALSQRQQLILKLIAEGRTNSDVADMLSYSESLIRQETIRIYDFLGCSGRLEAAEIYRNSNTKGKNLGDGGSGT